MTGSVLGDYHRWWYCCWEVASLYTRSFRVFLWVVAELVGVWIVEDCISDELHVTEFMWRSIASVLRGHSPLRLFILLAFFLYFILAFIVSILFGIFWITIMATAMGDLLDVFECFELSRLDERTVLKDRIGWEEKRVAFSRVKARHSNRRRNDFIVCFDVKDFFVGFVNSEPHFSIYSHATL